MRIANTHKRSLDEEWLRKMYLEEKHPLAFIAYLAGTWSGKVKEKLKEYNIPLREGKTSWRGKKGTKSY